MTRGLVIAACLAWMAVGCAPLVRDDAAPDAARVREAWSHKVVRYVHRVHHTGHPEVKKLADRRPADSRKPVLACDLVGYRVGCETY